MISINVVVAMILLHLLGDFFLQTGWMATNKSKNWWALWLHCIIYSFGFWVAFGANFWLITIATHLITDAITSRLTTRWFFFAPDSTFTKLWVPKVECRSWFFNTIGVDQAIHFITLLLTYHLVVK